MMDLFFLILSLYLTIKLELESSFECFSLFQIVAYSFCIHLQFFHFFYLEVSHTIVAYVSKIFFYLS